MCRGEGINPRAPLGYMGTPGDGPSAQSGAWLFPQVAVALQERPS